MYSKLRYTFQSTVRPHFTSNSGVQFAVAAIHAVTSSALSSSWYVIVSSFQYEVF